MHSIQAFLIRSTTAFSVFFGISRERTPLHQTKTQQKKKHRAPISTRNKQTVSVRVVVVEGEEAHKLGPTRRSRILGADKQEDEGDPDCEAEDKPHQKPHRPFPLLATPRRGGRSALLPSHLSAESAAGDWPEVGSEETSKLGLV